MVLESGIFLYRPVAADQKFLILKIFVAIVCSDWHLRSSLLHVWAEISVSAKVRAAFAKLVSCRNDNFEDSEEELQLRNDFLSSHGASFRMWLLQSCMSTHGAKRQMLWHTHLAKFYGLSRSGVRALSHFQLLSPLTSADRHWKTLLFNYRVSVRSCKCYICHAGVCMHSHGQWHSCSLAMPHPHGRRCHARKP